MTPFPSRPVTATMSSCSRPLRCVVVREDRREAALGEPGGEVDVVGGQVLDDADVGDARRERALPAGGDLVDLAEFARLDPLAQRPAGRG